MDYEVLVTNRGIALRTGLLGAKVDLPAGAALEPGQIERARFEEIERRILAIEATRLTG